MTYSRFSYDFLSLYPGFLSKAESVDDVQEKVVILKAESGDDVQEKVRIYDDSPEGLHRSAYTIIDYNHYL